MAATAPEPQQELRRERRRRAMRKTKRQEIANRVVDFYNNDQESRSADRNARLQRYAKFRQWTQQRGWPWPDASNQALPDITAAVLRTEDTIHNAVMSNRPVAVARALNKTDEEKQNKIDQLHDFQLFVEQDGEKMVEELVDQFVKEGVYTAFTPWVKDVREAREVRYFDSISDDMTPADYFETILRRTFPESAYREVEDSEGWDWTLTNKPNTPEESKFTISFYTRADDVEMVTTHEVEVFNGPRVFVKNYEEVVYPSRVENLQIPSPSNPGGAPHVILVDYPTVDEIARLQRRGVYNLIDTKDVEKLGLRDQDKSDQGEQDQKDTIGGRREDRKEKEPEHGRLTRLICFDLYDDDEDGQNEDWIWWVLLEEKLLLRARRLSEMYPFNPPRRPFAEATFLPIKGRREGIGLIELMEQLADFKKVVCDLMVDSGTLSNSPFFFYRPSSGLNPETFRPWPGDGIPVNDPNNDVVFPNLQNATQVWALNLMTMIQQMEERLNVIGDLQLGRVPAGKSSALRTLGGIQTILSQGEARPERILRRFFMGVREIVHQMHELNKRWLPAGKKFRILGPVRPDDDPYVQISTPAEIDGRFAFDFEANVLNASKAAQQASLETLLGVLVSDVAIQLGIVTPENVYRLMRDYGKALTQKVDRYITPPTPQAMKRIVTAEDAFMSIHQGATEFDWIPAEGAQAHYDKLVSFVQDDNAMGAFNQLAIPALKQYLQQAGEAASQERQLLSRARAAGGVGAPLGPGTPGRAATPPAAEQPTMVGENEVLDETMPSAQGRMT